MSLIGWSPLLPFWLLSVFGIIALIGSVIGIVRHMRGSVLRLLAVGLTLLWLAGPQLRHPVLRTQPQDVLVLVDRTPSMALKDRTSLATRAVKQLQDSAQGLEGLTLHVVDVPGGHGQGTRLFDALAREAPALPNLAGVITVTDGMDQDTPSTLPTTLKDAHGHKVPLHLLLTAKGEETDRRLRVLSAPPYVIVGQEAHIRVQAEDLGTQQGAKASLTQNHASASAANTQLVANTLSGQPVDLTVPVTHPGQMLEELTVSPLTDEVSLLNNSTVLRLQGVRDRLRVLLVSGVPNQGARVWRQLLKADPSVDLVHFTILRSPEMEDDTPLSDLALIPFPTHELFEQKIRSFDLIILDGFRNHNILPDSYLRNIADFVRAGGGLLVVSGPEQTQPGTLQNTPLGSVLPAHVPENGVETGETHIRPTTLGARHPVTSALPPASSWGPWYRTLRPDHIHGETLLETTTGQPLLVLDHVGKGRVAMMLSDQVWLWSRGSSNAGPQAELLRRLAHWLMKEPDLEENRLEASFTDGALVVRRFSATSLSEQDAQITTPEGQIRTLHLTPLAGHEGELVGKLPLGPSVLPDRIWVIKQGELITYAAPAPENPVEDADLRATATLIGPLAHHSGGAVHWLGQEGFPVLKQRNENEKLFGPDWLGVARRQVEVAGATRSVPLLPAWAALPGILLLLGAAWRREGH